MLAFALSSPWARSPRPGARGGPSVPAPRLAPVRSAGIYHVATGTWTRVPGASASAGPDIVFANDAGGSCWTGLLHEDGAQWVDEGQAPWNASPFGADRECYRVNGFQAVVRDVRAAREPVPRARPLRRLRPLHRSLGPGRLHQPGRNRAGGPHRERRVRRLAFWTITVDLAGGAEIDVSRRGSCAPGYDGVIGQDGFGWGATPHGARIGWLLAGDPDWTVAATGGASGEIGGGGTYYAPASGSCGNTGLNASDLWQVVEPAGGATTLGRAATPTATATCSGACWARTGRSPPSASSSSLMTSRGCVRSGP